MIRKFNIQDMDMVLNIWLEASIQAHCFISRDFWESKVSDMRNIYIPNSETYVYEADGTVKGFIALHHNTVAALFVSPDSQRQGIGTQLLEEAKSMIPNLNLTVYKANSNGIRFYRKCGFRVAKEQIDEHTGHPELLMIFP
ncbi:N-acetyltransferase [Maridesulfovibrio sp.]|uniref:N-acetyltransferase n=1 Tax=Maridesulfovibrio sp. TaxID=2795000 RepID=UPI002A187315|nr:N-acetyltransferase [Maridesulfovibrio sp.]